MGGVDFLAGYVARLKSENPDNVVVSAGDLTGASPLASSLFNDEGTIEAANRMGLEINAVGNHEFDRASASCGGFSMAAFHIEQKQLQRHGGGPRWAV